ncbi:unnamed protein product [Polarella glacialis]|uniref:Ubiquitin-like domain-containing protein n=1 Tax=Polarella glacialis TaxID=89957 RepID=A0A813DEV6_POLGL|nr:unnamed protein product [Polarella glacialis]CAE8643484.1 unnamed protein product [Polarella glacialis]
MTQIALTVKLHGGELVGKFQSPPECTINELKMQIARKDGTYKVQKDCGPSFQVLLLSTANPLQPVLLVNSQTLEQSGVKSGSDLVLLRLPFCQQCEGKCKEPSLHKGQQVIPWTQLLGGNGQGGQMLPDLSQVLVKNGVFGKYTVWRDEYRRWREGGADGAKGEAITTDALDMNDNFAWRDSYRSWRQGSACGAVGETGDACARPFAQLIQEEEHARKRKVSSPRDSPALGYSKHPPRDAPAHGYSKHPPMDLTKLRNLPAVVFDVVAESSEVPALVPVDGPAVAPIPVTDFPPESLITFRVFRFFEDRSDEDEVWEQELQDVNSGSLLWVPIHLDPGKHSKKGAKYGTWFAIHYVQVYAKHFKSAYHMANEGAHPAKTWGASSGNQTTISGETLPHGYYWYVSPSSKFGRQVSLGTNGWQHLCRAGPFDGKAFLEHWHKTGCSFEFRQLQAILNQVCHQ